MMRIGDIVDVDGVEAEVLSSSDLTTLDFKEIVSGKERWIGVAICGNPRVRVIKRNKGSPVSTPEWREDNV